MLPLATIRLAMPNQVVHELMSDAYAFALLEIVGGEHQVGIIGLLFTPGLENAGEKCRRIYFSRRTCHIL